MALYRCQGGATETYIVPVGVTHVFLSLAGGAGAGDSKDTSKGGLGARVEGTVAVQPGQVFQIIVGCAAKGRSGGIGGDGLDQVKGGAGGASTLEGDGGGGGGPSGVFFNTQSGGQEFVAGGGGGGSGFAGLTDGHNGGDAGLTTANPQATGNGGRGLGSTGGGGGGGGGGGSLGGAGGGGGSRFGQPGHAGDGGASQLSVLATNTKVVRGGGPRGDGYVLLAPLMGVRPAPQVSYLNCQGGTPKPYTVPANVTSLQVLVNGASGVDSTDSSAQGGAGASIQANLQVSAGQRLNAVVGCVGHGSSAATTTTVGGAGYSRGGDTGGVSQLSNSSAEGTGGGGSSAILNASQQPLVVAAGGGGAGGEGSSGSPGNGGSGSANGDTGSPARGSRAGSGGGGGAAGSAAGSNGKGTNCPSAGSGGGGGGGFRPGAGGGGAGGGAGGCGAIPGPGSGGGGGGGASFLTGNGTIAGGAWRGDGLVIIAAQAPGVPTVPTLVQATGSPLQATVSFSPPSDDGGAPITSYTVTSIPEGHTATGTTSPITVSGLTTRTPYTFTVHATNAIGNSAESGPSNPVTTVFAPNPPTNASATAGDGQATVTFAPPTSDGGRPITGYTAMARQGVTTTGPGISVSGAGSPITIGGLTNGTTYTIGVYATNEVGNGGEALAGAVVPLGLPGPPTDVNGTVVPGGVSVSFGPPGSTGGAPIDSYTVTSYPGNNTATGSASPILVSGLTNGTNYQFTVHATTRAGNGPESAPSNTITFTSSTALSPPLTVSAAPGDGQAIVSFHPPLDDGGSPVQSYTVTSNPGGLTATGSASPITVTGLTNGVSYTFTVIAQNANGTSQPSAPSEPVTPKAGQATSNDMFANAQPISGASGTVTGSNVGATKEPGEPNHDHDPGGASIWYTWSAPSGAVTFDTCGSSFATVIGAYQGSAVNALTLVNVERGIQTCADGSSAPSVVFNVAPGGGIFQIAIDGVNTGAGPATGSVTLNWRAAG